MCFDAAQSVEQAYALRLRSLLYHQAEERERLQTLVRPSETCSLKSVWPSSGREGSAHHLQTEQRQTSRKVYAPICGGQARCLLLSDLTVLLQLPHASKEHSPVMLPHCGEPMGLGYGWIV